MSSAVVPAPAPGRRLLLSDVDWMTYTRLLHVFAERPGVRLTYDRKRGIEADECYWIANGHRMQGRRTLDLRRDPAIA